MAIDYIKFYGAFRWQYSAIHGEVWNLGAMLDFVTQILFGINRSGNISFITSFAEYFSVQEYFVWKVFEWLQLVCSIPQDDANSISIKLVSHLDSILNLCLKPLRRNICDIRVFDGVLPQYFSGLN